MLHPLLLVLVSLASSTLGLQLDNLVTFGDSYTDEVRMHWFDSHNGHAPPPGLLLPASDATRSGGYSWGRFVANATGAEYYNYAVSGATCSSDIVSSYSPSTNGSFPSVKEYAIPAYRDDVRNESLYPNRKVDNTVYALWIGTNDLGEEGFLGDEQKSGRTITDYVDCVWDVFDRLYETGGRNFVLFNTPPLQYAPMYAPREGKAERAHKMLEYTSYVNDIFDDGVPFNLVVKRRWPDASFSVFDVNSLMRDIYMRPKKYLMRPAKVTGNYVDYRRSMESLGAEANVTLSNFMW